MKAYRNSTAQESLQKASNKKRGFGKLGFVGGIAILGVVAYFFSDYFKTKINQSWSELTEWTPDNIQKDPEGYFTYAIDKCDNTLEKFKVDELRVRIRLNAVRRKASKTEAELGYHVKVVDEGKKRHRIFMTSTEAPSQDHKLKVVTSARRVKHLGKYSEVLKNNERHLEATLKKVANGISNSQQLKEELKTSLEIVRVEKDTSEIVETKENLVGIMDTIKAINKMFEDDTKENSDLLMPTGFDAEIDTEYEQLMNGLDTSITSTHQAF